MVGVMRGCEHHAGTDTATVWFVVRELGLEVVHDWIRNCRDR